MSVGYIGFSSVMLQYIIQNDDLDISLCICEEQRCTAELKSLCEYHGIEFCIVKNKESMVECIHQHNEYCFIMYECGIIIPKNIVDKVVIVNFHPGSLENNRGRTPIITSVIRGDYYTKMSVYRIGELIDYGEEICSSVVLLDEKDNSRTIKYKLEETIPRLLDRVCEYFRKGTYWHEPGIYCEKVQEADYKIDLQEDTLCKVDKKIRSQAMYQGAVLNNHRINGLEVNGYEWNLLEENDEVIRYEIRADVSLRKRQTMREE